MMFGEDHSAKKRVAASSALAAVAITGLKLVVGLETNSLGILSEAAHSGLDLIAAIITYFAVSISDRPPDRDHLYGHGKVENISAFIETMLLVITCGWIIWEAAGRLLGKGAHVESSVWGFAVIGISVIVDFSRSKALRRAAKKYRSQALEADALHFSSDIWSSLVVLVGLALVSFGQQQFDSVAAIAVAVLVLFVSFRLGKRTIDALMDRVPEGTYDVLLSAIRGVKGVAEVKSLRVRASGQKLFVDTTIGIPRTLPFQKAHEVMDAVEKEVHSRLPEADLVIHSEPLEGHDESIAQKVQMITLAKGLGSPHNLEVHRRNERYHIDFDVEYTKGKEFIEAHDLASEIEEAIRKTIPDVEKVTIHMEEVHPGENETATYVGSEEKLLAEIGAVIREEPRILRSSGLTMLKIGEKYNLSVDCQFEKTRSLDETHQIISALKAKLFERFPVLRRITIHAEPG